jgi:hypothetical protein
MLDGLGMELPDELIDILDTVDSLEIVLSFNKK